MRVHVCVCVCVCNLNDSSPSTQQQLPTSRGDPPVPRPTLCRVKGGPLHSPRRHTCAPITSWVPSLHSSSSRRSPLPHGTHTALPQGGEPSAASRGHPQDVTAPLGGGPSPQ